VLQAFVGHRIAAVFDDDGFAVEITDVGQRLGQDLRLDLRRDRSQVVVLVVFKIKKLAVMAGPKRICEILQACCNQPRIIGLSCCILIPSDTLPFL
jgi:hypothetical protein